MELVDDRSRRAAKNVFEAHAAATKVWKFVAKSA
jgi:hypothetical protein